MVKFSIKAWMLLLTTANFLTCCLMCQLVFTDMKHLEQALDS